ncbi:MAG: membrane protein [Melioribacteraceae bacterium]|nr:MAG: membrane protein [Melioribacteraceae bacterium]
MITSELLIFLIPLAVVLTTYSKYAGKRNLLLFSKPLTITLIILLAFNFYPESFVQGKEWVIAALVASAFGDIFLMFKEKMFKAGILAFLAAHIFYLLFFIDGMLVSKLINYYSLAIYILAGVLTYMITEKAGKYKILVSIYVFALASMAAFSIPYFLSTGDIKVVIAALLFMISDFVLGWNKFNNQLKYAELIILPTYFAAQFLFALSINI